MSGSEREEALVRIAEAGRSMSDAAVLFHGVLAERMGLSGSHWKTLGLVERFGPQSPGELADRSGLAPASMSGILDRLEAKNLVTREEDPDDRRRIRVALDPTGVQAMYGLFAGLMRGLGELHDEYDTDALHLIATYMARAAEIQREATAELSGRWSE